MFTLLLYIVAPCLGVTPFIKFEVELQNITIVFALYGTELTTDPRWFSKNYHPLAFFTLFYLVQGEIILQTNFWLFNFLIIYFVFTILVGIWAKYNISNRKLALTK